MSWKEFLAKGYVVNYIASDDSNIDIMFKNSDQMLSISACSDCCDINTFECNTKMYPIIGTNITNIFEGEGVHQKSNSIDDSTMHFPITIEFNRNTILQELRKKNEKWKTLPKDIFNVIADKLKGKYNFWRINSSNGYYSGYIEIRLKPVPKKL